MKKEDFVNDIKAVLTIILGWCVSKSVNELFTVIGLVITLIYGVYRVWKVKIDVDTSKLERDIKKIQLQNMRENKTNGDS